MHPKQVEEHLSSATAAAYYVGRRRGYPARRHRTGMRVRMRVCLVNPPEKGRLAVHLRLHVMSGANSPLGITSGMSTIFPLYACSDFLDPFFPGRVLVLFFFPPQIYFSGSHL
uniref:Uncharacterized protein n=1 Tax=Oryza brachyantha TaxID=4533 RepID=J3L9Y7_ORYBR